MSRLHRSEYELEWVKREKEKIVKVDLKANSKDTRVLGRFANMSVAEIARRVRSELLNGEIEIEGSETEEIGKGKKITARTSNDEEIEVVFMPNGEILTHVESKDKVKCQQLAEQFHQRVLQICKEVAEREGFVFQLKSEGKKPAFLEGVTDRKAPIGNPFVAPKAQKFSK